MNSRLFDTAKASRIGNRRTNQDRCVAIQSQHYALLALGDGMGGHPKGELAAQIFVDTCESFFFKASKPIANPRHFLSKMIIHAHDEITAYGFDQEPAIDPRTTGVVALIQGRKAYWAHVGDSRFYLIRGANVQTRTLDHSYVEHLKREGMISEADQQKHPQRHYVTRCLGGSFSAPGVTLGDAVLLEHDDVLFLCSDGLWGHIDEEEMVAAFQSELPLHEALTNLVREAELAAFPDSDNVTAVALRWKGHKKPAQDAAAKTRAGQQTGIPRDLAEKDRLHKAIEELTSVIDQFETKGRK